MEEKGTSPGRLFVERVLQRSKQDNGFSARMSRADNPDTEYMALGPLCAFGINVERDDIRLPYALIGAALCRGREEKDGSLSIGEALRKSVDKESGSSGELEDNPRLRRLLACDSVSEVCMVLRTILAFIQSRGVSLCYAGLLDDLLRFRGDEARQRIKRRWAQGFYARNESSERNADEG